MILDPDTFRANLLRYTTLAYNLLPKLDRPNILDVGCGTGVPTIHLAELSGAMITALDSDRVALAKLEARLAQEGLSSRVRIVNASMQDPPLEKGSYDVVWAEGSISQLGFDAALEMLGQYARKNRFLVLHDDADDYLQKMSTVQSKRFSLLGFFLLSDEVWWEEYYKHLEAGLASTDSVCPPYTREGVEKELEQYRNEPKRFQSAFFITQKPRSGAG